MQLSCLPCEKFQKCTLSNTRQVSKATWSKKGMEYKNLRPWDSQNFPTAIVSVVSAEQFCLASNII